MTVVTRFAPSPTGYLHIGGARTALFNWLFSRHHGDKFHLRIEDTDRERSTQAAIDAIIAGLQWLGLDWDGEIVYQSTRAARHAEVAHELVAQGQAYFCYMTPGEIEAERAKARAEGKNWRYDGSWRDRAPKDAPAGVQPAIRIKAPLSGKITVHDQVQGEITVDAAELDDMVLLRSDGTPTYMLAVVVDDRDMGITHIIRGSDHLTNSFRQRMIYDAMGWQPPAFAHIPLIHGSDGAKLSKRHGALGVEAYRDMGYLPEAMRNYLLRLGWGHGDDEIISTKRAVEWFGLGGVGKSPARFDFAKLESLNAHYLREADDARLVELILPLLPSPSGRGQGEGHLPEEEGAIRLLRGMSGLKQRAKTLVELAESAKFYIQPRPIPLNEKASQLLDSGGQEVLKKIYQQLDGVQSWTAASLEALAKQFAEQENIKLGQIAQPLRAALTGNTVSPPIFEVMEVLGKEETLGRMRDLC